jgi:hypothetical protein
VRGARVLVLLLLLGSGLLAIPAHALGLVDQSVTATPTTTDSAINSVTRDIGQTFTAGMTGQLDAVSLPLAASPSPAEVVVTIYAASLGQPTGPALATSLATVTGFAFPPPQWTLVTFSPAASVIAGMSYAIVLGPVPSDFAFVNWATSAADVYEGGTAFVLFDPILGPYAARSWDFDFQTLVTPLVPPQSFANTGYSPTLSNGVPYGGSGFHPGCAICP